MKGLRKKERGEERIYEEKERTADCKNKRERVFERFYKAPQTRDVSAMEREQQSN